MSETIILDPSAVADADRTEIALTDDAGPIRILSEGPAWSEATVELYMAEGEYGSIPIDRTFANRTVEIPLVVFDGEDGSGNPVSFHAARRQLQQWVALVQESGRGWIMRETDEGPAYFDIVRATLRAGGGNLQAWGHADPEAVLSLEILPDGYGDEVLLGSGTVTGGGVVSLPGVPGDYSARMRAVITDAPPGRPEAAQRSLLYAIRPARTDPTAAIDFEATALARFGGSARTDHVVYSALPPTWVAVLSTDVAGVGKMSHIGPHRVWALFETSAAAQVRLEWAEGSSAAFRANGIVTLPTGGTWADLGEVSIETASAGAQQWEGRILANGSALRIYKVLVVPTAHASGYVNASTVIPTASTVSAWDDFDSHAAGSLDGKTAPAGGRWSGAGTGSAIVADPGSASWSGSTAERFCVLLETSLGFTDMRADIGAVAIPGAGESATSTTSLVARYIDANNWVRGMAHVSRTRGGALTSYRLRITVCVAGVWRSVETAQVAGSLTTGTELRFVVENGSATLFLGVGLALSFSDAALAAGNALERGSPGLHASASRTGLVGGGASSWENFYVASSTAGAITDAVLHAGRAAELATTGYARANASHAPGDAWARLTPIGALPRCPVGDAELYVRFARSTIGQPLPSIDGDLITEDPVSVEVYGRPCYQFTA